MDIKNNTDIFEKVAKTPADAQKKIAGGRLKGFTDISPMWRVKQLTELFGPCGVGWYPKTIKKWIETYGNEAKAFVDIELYVKINGEWSAGIEGNGGSSFVSIEKGSPYVNDECYKMAFTDALGSACKLLGFSYDIFSDKYDTKYSTRDSSQQSQQNTTQIICKACNKPITGVKVKGKPKTPAEVAEACNGMCYSCYKQSKKQ